MPETDNQSSPSPAAARSDFRRVSPRVNLKDLEARVQKRWDESDAFRASVEMRPADREYTFYDGPPFASGSPHYGNILAGVIKDVVPRYWTMRGYRVERRFGWDTHGLPIEMEVENRLGVSGPRQIEEFGVDRFNAACREMVEVTTEEWEEITRRIGRWVDFENDYKTMDPEFMESVWWVFRALWDKDLVYRDFKVLPYSWAAGTTLSNFEVSLGGYREVEDPAVTVRLQVAEGAGPVRAGDYLTIWTTTPWTLLSNLAVAVAADAEYSAVEIDGERYWAAADLLGAVWDDPPPPADSARGAQLLGAAYRPAFPYFERERAKGAFRVIPGEEVSTGEGTGLVHMAPAYGEEDFYALAAAGIEALVDPVDMEARFTDRVPELAGTHVHDAEQRIIQMLEDSGALLKQERITHSYPYCYRTDTPLIYKAIPTWFVRVERIRERMAELNRSIHWVPERVGSHRFGNWLEDARDWAVSRNRYWGSCIPVWECGGCGRRECFGGREELRKRSGVWLEDMHKHVADLVVFPCPDCPGEMRRVPEVLDCWFESGSMPYAHLHYPFENRDRFQRGFPADFIAEGLDQTRGWFYTLHVLSCALFDEVAFRNCVVNGLILAGDGRKMSKRLKNYPEPLEVLDKYGGDAVRAYLINSPVLRAEPVRFSEEGVRDVVRTVILPFWNTYSFFTTYAAADGITFADLRRAPAPGERPEIDRWIISVLQSLISQTNALMEGCYLYSVVGPALGFVDDLTNWYVRRSRRRFWRSRGEGGPESERDKLSAFATLYEALTAFSRLLAPVLPFITDEIHLGLAPEETTVHHADFPQEDRNLIDEDLESSMAIARQVVRLGRSLRLQHSVGVRRPAASLTVLTSDPQTAAAAERHGAVIAEELNVKRIGVSSDELSLVELSAKPNFKTLGPRLGAEVKNLARSLAGASGEELARFLESGEMTVGGHRLGAGDVVVTRTPRPGMATASEGAVSVAMDIEPTAELVAEGLAREVVSRIQGVRRELDLDVSDRIRVGYHTSDPQLAEAVAAHAGFISGEALAARLAADPQLATAPASGPGIRECRVGQSLIVLSVGKHRPDPAGG